MVNIFRQLSSEFQQLVRIQKPRLFQKLQCEKILQATPESGVLFCDLKAEFVAPIDEANAITLRITWLIRPVSFWFFGKDLRARSDSCLN